MRQETAIAFGAKARTGWTLAVAVWLGAEILLLLLLLLPIPDLPAFDPASGEGKPLGLLVGQLAWGSAWLAIVAIALGAVASLTLLTASVFAFFAAKTLPLPRRRFAALSAATLLATVAMLMPISFRSHYAASPVVLSSADAGIVIVPEIVWGESVSLGRGCWCAALGYFAPASCAPERVNTGLHLWFLSQDGLESFVIGGFPFQSSAYVYQGRLRWYRGTQTWEWRSDHFEELYDDAARAPFLEHRYISDVLAAEGWQEEQVNGWNDALKIGEWSLSFESSGHRVEAKTLRIDRGAQPRVLFHLRENNRFFWPGTPARLTAAEGAA